MKIGILSDSHLDEFPRNRRLKETAFFQFQEAVKALVSKGVNVVIHAGDFFHRKDVDFTTISRVIPVLREVKEKGIPFIVIHGNHDLRENAEKVNAVSLLDKVGLLHYIHAEWKIFEDLGIFGLGYLPFINESLLRESIPEKPEGIDHSLFLLHQTICETSPFHDENCLSLKTLKELGFDLIVNGHIHKQEVLEDDGRVWFIQPGSTVATSFDASEISPRKVFIYDTELEKAEAIEFPQVPLVMERIHLSSENEGRARELVQEVVDKWESRFRGKYFGRIVVSGNVSSKVLEKLVRIEHPRVEVKPDLSVLSPSPEFYSKRSQVDPVGELKEKLSKKLEFIPLHMIDALLKDKEEAINVLEGMLDES